MATSRKHRDSIQQQTNTIDSNVQRGRYCETEWQTPVLSEKFQRRTERRPSTADSGDTALGTSCSDSTEDFCSSSGCSLFKPIRSLSIIPTALVMPSTSGNTSSNLHPVGDSGFTSVSMQPSDLSDTQDQRSGKQWSSLSKLNGVDVSNFETRAVKTEEPSISVKPLPVDSTNRPALNVLDGSYPNVEYLRSVEMVRKFETPNIEPTLNQSAFLNTIYDDPRYNFQECSKEGQSQCINGAGSKDSSSISNMTFKSLPESRNVSTNSGLLGQRPCLRPNGAGSVPEGLHSLQAQQAIWAPVWLKERPCGKQFDVHSNDKPGDLTTWQQQQLESLRQQVEQMQVLNHRSHQYPAAYSTFAHQELNKWDPLIKANESLLKEKEMVIERQKQQISHLEQKMRESELQMHNALLGHPVPLSDVCILRLQESLRENAFLRAQYAERTEMLTNEKLEMEKKLTGTEMEIRHLNDSLKENTQKHMDDMKRMEEKVRGRDKHINNLKRKCQKEAEQNREKQQRIETLERYLADLPTLDDYQKQSRQLKDVELQCQLLQGTVLDLETKLGESRALCREKDSILEKQKQKELELVSTVHGLQEKVAKCLEDGVRLPIMDVEKLKCESNNLKGDYERAMKIIDKQQKSIEQLTSQVQALQERVAQEEGTSQGLREELSGKENGSQLLRKAMKELSAQNQELIERNLTLQEQLGQLDQSRQPPSESMQLLEKLHRELARSLHDLQAICNILTQRTQGKDPNLSLLLGIQSMHYSSAEEGNWQNTELLTKRLAEVRQLGRDIDELRTRISDRYAQDMGDNCITQ
ncbi:centrosomal protein of 85 kDa isoform X1 [Rhincodon typus]|uniref:centrosomal protein of 85 kDa isoform X1 n=2 Tax=Rhincodon typus TaxID=259920 RepID=UPI00202EE53D|nr:centrosomal protein of 85 kDa isoform X1 [Rhincodon typus]XP_048468982.1 centrosomal protein of 85 kDa isoform X1 [Rhincodon typus]XP_048468983.1 centrosomal protein of 85 kDa isoform X1 [Rhincodon typus]